MVVQFVDPLTFRTCKIPLNRKKPILLQLIEKLIKKLLKNTILFYLYGFVVIYLNNWFIMKCLTFFKKWFNTPKLVSFQTWNSCINQLLCISHKILSAFDIGLEVRRLFLDISKAFNNIWHAELIYKLRQNGICGDVINILHISWPT